MPGLKQPILTHLTDAKIPTTNSYPSHGCQDYIKQFYPSHACRDSNNEFLSFSRMSGSQQQIRTHLKDAKMPTTNSYPSHGYYDNNNQFL